VLDAMRLNSRRLRGGDLPPSKCRRQICCVLSDAAGKSVRNISCTCSVLDRVLLFPDLSTNFIFARFACVDLPILDSSNLLTESSIWFYGAILGTGSHRDAGTSRTNILVDFGRLTVCVGPESELLALFHFFRLHIVININQV